jgi:hypothetical protein
MWFEQFKLIAEVVIKIYILGIDFGFKSIFICDYIYISDHN